ncbi:MAG: phosphodiester glycosidase family protein [Bacteroidales bacterium]|nr:phosphodiester glycosidase family protein [Bacteroidales bacterium]
MIKKTILFISVLIFSFAYLRAQESRLEIDTLYHQIDTMQYRFARYVPQNAHYHFQRVKPDSNNTNLLMSVVAAFTSKAPEHVVGTSVSNGKKRIYPTDAETAYCLIVGEEVKIEALSENHKSAIETAVKQKGDYFQQMLLIENAEAKSCEIFKNRATFRRALAQKEGETHLVESLDRMTIDDFIQSLIFLGYEQAIYLDMGSWSEGWYRNDENEIIRIGNNWKSSHLQTNWLVIRKNKSKT